MSRTNDEILQTSGNNLHIRIGKLLKKLEWAVSIGEDYIDDQTGKRRESDIIAYKKILLTSPDKKKDVIGDFYVYLIIESKYFTKEVTFRTLKVEGEMKNQFKNVVICNDQFSKTYPKALKEINKVHHYLTLDKVAKLIDTGGNNSRHVSQSIEQPIKGLIFHRKHHNNQKIMYFLLSVYDGIDGIFEVYGNIISEKKLTQHQVYTTSFKYRDELLDIIKNGYFSIDFVNYNYLRIFIENKIQKEIKSFKNIVSAHNPGFSEWKLKKSTLRKQRLEKRKHTRDLQKIEDPEGYKKKVQAIRVKNQNKKFNKKVKKILEN